MEKDSTTIFERDWRVYYEMIAVIGRHFVGKSIFISEPNTYRTLTVTNPAAGASIYWFEILGRAYLASASGLMRTLRWLEGIESSITRNNLLSFAATLRGLLESAADQCYSLKAVPKTLAENFGLIMEQLYCKSSVETVFVCEELENLLIHFYHARKISKRDDAESQHFALTSADYLASLQGGRSGPVFDLYARLCELSHPTMGSLTPFVDEDPEGGYLIKAPNDKQAIRELCATHAESILRMTAGVNCCLLTLRVLNEFPVEDLHTDAKDLALDIPGWSMLENMIDNQR
jgi:hypothetical protein